MTYCDISVLRAQCQTVDWEAHKRFDLNAVVVLRRRRRRRRRRGGGLFYTLGIQLNLPHQKGYSFEHSRKYSTVSLF
jgi:hypothetical protein